MLMSALVQFVDKSNAKEAVSKLGNLPHLHTLSNLTSKIKVSQQNVKRAAALHKLQQRGHV